MVPLTLARSQALLVAAIPDWVPWAIVGAGIALLGAVVIGAMVAGRRGADRARAAAPRADAAELKDLTAGVLAELDRKTRELERLIAAADERIEALRRTGPEVTARSDARAVRTRAPATAVEAPMDALTAEICRLSEEGLSPVEIAGRLGQHVGKVELILALRR